MQVYKRNEIYEEKKQMEIMNELLTKLLLAQLSSMGLISSNSLSRFQAQTKLPDFYNKWLEVSLDFWNRNTISNKLEKHFTYVIKL
ncbi:hypothetical protein ACLMAB_09955 [Brevibacillus laterosporus]